MKGELEAVILAGGRGTRLQGLWDGPKCLAPIGRTPILGHILMRLTRVVSRATIIVGWRSEEVIHWISHWQATHPRLAVSFLAEANPRGTAHAFRVAIPFIKPPVLVMNGDTLPRFNLDRFVWVRKGVSLAAWHEGKYAGTALLQQDALDRITDMEWEPDLDFFTHTLQQVEVEAGFFDIGTPRAFKLAQEGKIEP